MTSEVVLNYINNYSNSSRKISKSNQHIIDYFEEIIGEYDDQELP